MEKPISTNDSMKMMKDHKSKMMSKKHKGKMKKEMEEKEESYPKGKKA